VRAYLIYYLSCGWGASEDDELLPCRWVVFDSPAEVPFKYGNVTWIRNGGCQCSCADMAACAAEGRAPAWGMGLVAQHTCRERVERVPVWHKARPFHQLKCDCMRWCTLMLPNLEGCAPAWGMQSVVQHICRDRIELTVSLAQEKYSRSALLILP
jgi:hypothetical protein